MANKLKYSKKITDEYCELISLGNNIGKAAAKLGLGRKTVYTWMDKYPDFDKRVTAAYTQYFMTLQDELDDISGRPASEIYPNLDWREAEAALKRRIDTLKFTLGKMAPMISKRYDKIARVELEHSGSVEQIQVVSYAIPEKIINSLEHVDD